DDVIPFACQTPHTDGKHKNPQPTGQELPGSHGYERQAYITSRVIIARKNGDIVINCQFAHQFDTIGFRPAEPVPEPVNHECNFQTGTGHMFTLCGVYLPVASCISAGNERCW